MRELYYVITFNTIPLVGEYYFNYMKSRKIWVHETFTTLHNNVRCLLENESPTDIVLFSSIAIFKVR